MLALAAVPALLSAQRKFDEREIKATFLFNFAQFVEWPAASFADAQAPLVIGVLGADPFDAVLDAVVRGEVIKSRPLVVTRFRRVEDVETCHILFVSPSEAPRYARIAEALHNLRSDLTIRNSAELGWPPQIIEGAAFALLAWRRWHNQPANIPETTGARGLRLLGQITSPPAATSARRR